MPITYTPGADLHFFEARDRYRYLQGYLLEPCKRLCEVTFDNVHTSKPNPETPAVLPTINSPHFTTVTFLAHNANTDFDYPLKKYWRKVDEALAVLRGNLAEKCERKLNVVFDGWRVPVKDEDATEKWRDLLPKFTQVGDITFKYMDPPVRADLGGHLKYSRRWSGVRAGVLLGAQGAVRRGENRGGL